MTTMEERKEFETTKLLPEINPYINEVDRRLDMYKIWVSYKGKIYTTWSFEQALMEVFVKDTWSFEDIRLYLREKGYEFYVTTVKFKNDSSKTEYKAVIDVFFESGYSFENEIILDSSYESFEETRLAVIQHCLNLINNENIYS